jgi:hypothetical protein
MNDQVRDIALRLGPTLGQPVDAEWFGPDDCWGMAARLEALMNAKKPIAPAALGLLEDLAIALNVRRGEEVSFHAALEAQLGPCPFPPEVIAAVVRYVRSQLHFKPSSARVQLSPGGPTHVPLKNYDFE